MFLQGGAMEYKKMNINYDVIADYYDIYANAEYDIPFFLEQSSEKRKILELTSGTGRLSIPLIEAGKNLTCIDQSKEMLAKLEQKLREKNLKAEVVCMDLLHIRYSSVFDLAIVPFQSFMEIIGRENQTEALRRIYASLMPGGTLVCTMHNPVIRKKSVDGVPRFVGHFHRGDETLSVSGVETGGKPVVERYQFF